MQIGASLYKEFEKLWNNGEFQHLRYGQAFYNHFNLDKCIQKPWMHRLYNADKDVAYRIVFSIVDWNN